MVNLTIAIPTHNRINELKRQLNKISLIKDNRIKILVSNNGSSDGTFEYLTHLAEEIPELTVIHNETNVGFDENIKILYKNARTYFVWFLSDDDPISIQHISKLLDTLNHVPDLGIVALNPYSLEKDFLKTRMVSYANSGKNLKLLRNVPLVLNDDKEIRTAVGTLVSQISSCVVKKFNKIDLDFNGGGIPHVVIAHRVLELLPTFMLLDSSVVSFGGKDSISNWFLDSCLNGTKLAYENLVPFCGEYNCVQVIESTKILGLRIAFWARGSEYDKFDHSQLDTYDSPKQIKFKVIYIWWWVAFQFFEKMNISVYVLFKIRHFTQRLRQKTTIISNLLIQHLR